MQQNSHFKKDIIWFGCVIILILGIFFLFTGIDTVRRAIKISHFDKKEALILRHEIYFDNTFRPQKWRWIMHGLILPDEYPFSTRQMAVGMFLFNEKEAFEGFARDFPEGSLQIVYVSPVNPKEVVLRQSDPLLLSLIPLAGLVLVILAFVLLRRQS